MKVKILRNTVAQGKAVNIGEVIDLQQDDARLLIGMGKALPVGEKTVPEAAVLPSAEAPGTPGEKADAPAPAAGKKGAKKGKA
jgi:hypothetical protein